MLLRCAAITLLLGSAAFAADPDPAWRARQMTELADDYKAANDEVTQLPNSVEALSHRGDLNLFLGHFPEAVADFEKMIALDPAQDAPHWRLGIAYYFDGQFAKSVRQFEKYNAYDGRDRENGIWKFLGQAKAEGLEKARQEMLTYKQFDREPFPELYAMFAGQRTPDDVLAEIERKEPENHVVLFFVRYYAGLGEEMLGHRERALELLRQAVEDPEARKVGYMWQVARLQWERLRAEPPATK